MNYRRRQRRSRRGNILFLTALLMIGMLGFVAFAVDLGYLMVARTEMQRTADAAAIAAAWDLVGDSALTDPSNYAALRTNATSTAGAYALLNPVLGDAPSLASEDVQVGYLSNILDPNESNSMLLTDRPNTVRVVVKRTAQQNGAISLFFARALGIDSSEVEAEATAGLITNVAGFRAAPNEGNVGILPFALDLDTLQDLLDGTASDDWTWDAETGQAVAGADGIPEVNLYPQGTGSPGNRGTVDIGSSNNSTADIARQILYGISPSEFEYHGGSLEFDEYGELSLNADTGISAGVKDELASIIGKPRIIPVFSQIAGNGNNANYTIVVFAGIRIMDVKLTGQMSGKHVTIQPATVSTLGVIPATGDAPSSYNIYSPAWIIR